MANQETTDSPDAPNRACVQRVVGWLRRIGQWINAEEKWCVIYPDGQRSRRMKRRDAKAYKAIFGGSVVLHKKKPANDQALRPEAK